MSTSGEREQGHINGLASAAITKGHCVIYHASTARTFTQASGAGARCAGVAAYTVAAGEDVKIIQRGQWPCIAGAAVATGVSVSTNASGRVITGVATHFPLGVSREAAGADGDVFNVDLACPQFVALA